MIRTRAPNRLISPGDLAFLSPAQTCEDDCLLDLSAVEWISPLGVVALLATCRGLDEADFAASVMPPRSIQVRTYLHHIGFYGQLEAHGWEMDENDRQIDPAMRIRSCLPLMPIGTEHEVEVAGEALKEALAREGISGNYTSRIFDVAVELTGNAREHGSQCYAVAQTHSGASSGTPGVHLAVADFGRGFAATLEPVYGSSRTRRR